MPNSVTNDYKKNELNQRLQNLERQEWRTELDLRKAKALDNESAATQQQAQLEKTRKEIAFYKSELKTLEQ